MTEGASALTYPVRLWVVGRYLGQLAAMLGTLTLPACGVSFLHGSTTVGLIYLSIAGFLLSVAWLGRRGPEPSTVQTNEAIVVVALTFVLTAVLMTVPFAVGGLAPVDALFEAVSAITTTGLSTLRTVEGATPAFLFERAWLQWCGGLGIAALSVALFMGHHVAARRLTSPINDTNLASMARTQARQILRVYVILTLAGTLVLSMSSNDIFAAFVTMLATLSTGGFSPFNASVAALPQSGAWIVTLFALLGACPLLLYYSFLIRQPGELASDPEVRTFLALVVIAATLLGLSLWWNSDLAPWEAIRHGFMLGTSAQTTTGFSTLTVANLDMTSKLLLISSMIVGGCGGSTAGGIKVFRLLILLQLAQYYLRRTAMPPHAVAEPRLSGRVLVRPEIEQAILIIILFVMTIGLSWIAFAAYGYPPLDALFEVVSAVGTVGLSTGITSAELQTPLKLLLCVDMLLGRLEVLAMLVVLYPVTWFGRRAG